MATIYRYIDLNDDVIKYIGIVFGNTRTLAKRVKEHQKDWWYPNGVWRIEYITEMIDSRSEAEAFESHYISLYNTDKYYNKAKAGWGVNKYLPDRTNDFVEYIPGVEIMDDIKQAKRKLKDIESQYHVAVARLNDLKDRIADSEKRLMELQNNITICEQQTGKTVCADKIYSAIDAKADVYKRFTCGITTKSSIEKWERLQNGMMVAKEVVRDTLLSA